MGEEALDLAAVEDGRKPFGSLGAGDVLQDQILATENLLIEEYEGVEGLVLGRGGDLALDGEVAQEGDDLRLAHFVGMALAVKQDVALGPFEVGLLGADAVVLAADEVAHLPQQFRAADDFARVHRNMGIAAWSSCRVHAWCPFLEFLTGFLILPSEALPQTNES